MCTYKIYDTCSKCKLSKSPNRCSYCKDCAKKWRYDNKHNSGKKITKFKKEDIKAEIRSFVDLLKSQNEMASMEQLFEIVNYYMSIKSPKDDIDTEELSSEGIEQMYKVLKTI